MSLKRMLCLAAVACLTLAAPVFADEDRKSVV